MLDCDVAKLPLTSPKKGMERSLNDRVVVIGYSYEESRCDTHLAKLPLTSPVGKGCSGKHEETTHVSDSSTKMEERITPGHTKGGDPPYIFIKLPLAPRPDKQPCIAAPQMRKKANIQGLIPSPMLSPEKLKNEHQGDEDG
jgi:hypothetical protein